MLRILLFEAFMEWNYGGLFGITCYGRYFCEFWYDQFIMLENVMYLPVAIFIYVRVRAKS